MEKLRIDIWSDIACPWCYIGKRHLERALATFEHAADVEIVWRAFELDPSAPNVRTDPSSNAERIAAKYRVSTTDAERMIERVIDAGTRAGLDLRLHDTRPCNTFDAHRLLRWALEHGKQRELKERVMRAYMIEGQTVGDYATLAALAHEVGLDAAEARAMLASERYAADVRRDEARARDLGINGVPFFVLDGRIGMSGAQPIETMSLVLAKAWSERARPMLEPFAEGAACTSEGCD